MKISDILRFLVAGAFLVLIGWFVLLTDDPQMRYQPSFKCWYRLIFYQDGPVDYVAMGSSRMLRAFGGPELADALHEQCGKQAVVYDLSRSLRGWGAAYVMLRDLLERRKVGHIIMDFNSTNVAYYRHFYFFGKMSDIWESVIAETKTPLSQRLANATRLSLRRFSHRLIGLENGTIRLSRPIRKRTKPASGDCIRSDTPVRTWDIDRYKRARGDTWAKAKGFSWDPDSAAEQRSTYYYKKIVALARAHGTKITFLHIPRIYDRGLEPEFMASSSKRFGVEVLNLPAEVLDELFATKGYGDDVHMTPLGRKRTMRWLSTHLCDQ